MTSLFARRWSSGVWIALLVAVLSVPASIQPLLANEVRVIVNQAKLVKLPEKVATIVIGNPLIADVSLQPGSVIVITGKSYGLTNLVALDRAGNVLMERMLQVEGANENVVVVYRGVERATYSCTPDCNPRINVGDSKIFFDTVLNQTMVRAGAALAGSQPR